MEILAGDCWMCSPEMVNVISENELVDRFCVVVPAGCPST